ncbi:calcium-binding protein [Nocardioides sp. HM23]|uniref:calcium-binding protein n=1 Tax=Nocardioides bizhenqiangii TaxID=3095076 RepID=UPI002ACAEBB8|nr:calcium-binding protein [Nocardioides sp. HM23]MDZ5620969.1 calcium-binding protein [Nocardioides sp. HM23]
MTRRRLAAASTIAALATLGALLNPGQAAGGGIPPLGAGSAGPPYDFTTELMGDGPTLIPLPDQAMITRTEHGYLFRAGQQDSHLVVTLTEDGLRFADTGTNSFKRLARRCRRVEAKVGVAAVCRVPAGISASAPLLLEVWPRLGDDYFDGSSLPATFAMTMLSDAGHDVALFGAGPDFFNGFTGRDQVWGGGGNDWIRTGQEADLVWGGAGDDQLVGTDGNDVLYGEAGDDLVGGGTGNDRLDGGAGSDTIRCEGGADTAWTDGADRLRDCETLHRS